MALGSKTVIKVNNTEFSVFPILRATGPGYGIFGIGKQNDSSKTWHLTFKSLQMLSYDLDQGTRWNTNTKYLAVDCYINRKLVQVIFDVGCSVSYTNLNGLSHVKFEGIDMETIYTQKLGNIYGVKPFIIFSAHTLKKNKHIAVVFNKTFYKIVDR